jgi:hypothetical protein
MDSRGVAARLPLLSQYGLEGAAVWHLGGLDQASWTQMQAYAAGLPAAPTSSDTRVPVTVRVRVGTYEPDPGQTFKMRVRIRPRVPDVVVKRQKRVNGRWYTLARERTNDRGRVRFTVQWPNRDMTIVYRIKTRKTPRLASGRSERFTISTR